MGYKSPKRIDLIILCMPVLALLLISPFYFEDVAFKIEHLRNLIENQDAIFYTKLGFMPAYLNFILQFSIGILFSSIAIYMLMNRIKSKQKVKSEFIWLIGVSSLMLLGNTVALIGLLVDSSTLDLHSLTTFLFSLYLIAIFAYLFFEPRVLYGASLENKKKSSGSNQIKQDFSIEELGNHREQIDNFFELETAYLKPEFRQEDLATYLNISKNHCSQMITNFYQKNFNQLVNEKRIEIVLKKFENSEWLKYSLDGVALLVGFKSRTTFIKAFKAKTGVNPSEYKKLHISQSL